MEEKFKRSKRRFDGLNAIKRRAKKWLSFGISHDENNKRMTSNAEKMECVLSGRGYTFLRTTGNPCNCSMCTWDKYRRERSKFNRNAQKEINEQVL